MKSPKDIVQTEKTNEKEEKEKNEKKKDVRTCEKPAPRTWMISI